MLQEAGEQANNLLTRPTSGLDQAHAGQEIVIARTGKSVARLIPAGKRQTRRSPGTLAWRFSLPTGFDAFLPEEVE